MTVALVPAPRQNPTLSRAKGSAPRGAARGSIPELRRVTWEEINRAAPCTGPVPRRDHLLVRFLWVTGARIGEARAVIPSSFDFGALCVRLRTLKRRAEHFRAIPLPPSFCGLVAQALLYWRPMPDERIFPWGRTQAYVHVRQVLEAAGIETGRARPHTIRHGHAFHALANGVTVPALQAALGHAHLSTTAIYARATAADVRVFYDRVPW